MKLSGDGLRLVIAMNYMNTLYYYKRNSMNDVFSISVVEGDGILGQGGVSISWDGQIVLVIRSYYVLRLYYCVLSVINMSVPDNGIDLIYNTAQIFNSEVIAYNQLHSNSSNTTVHPGIDNNTLNSINNALSNNNNILIGEIQERMKVM